jgi:hypothetical protein
METLWDVIKEFYKQHYNIPPEIIDYIAVNPILMKCASGYGNKRIGCAIDEPIDYIKEIIEKYYGFTGWTIDLDVNPLALYNRTVKNYGDFVYFEQEIKMVSVFMTDTNIKLAWNICRKYYLIKKEVEKYYGEIA